MKPVRFQIVPAIAILVLGLWPSQFATVVHAAQIDGDSATELASRLDAIDRKLEQLTPNSQSWSDFLFSHQWVDPATFYFVMGLSAYGVYRLRRARHQRRYEYVTYVLNVPLPCHDGRAMPDHLVADSLATDREPQVAGHGLVTGILREDKLEAALDRKQLGQLDTAVKAATEAGFLPLDHDMFAMFRTEISEIFNHYFMSWERKAQTFESAKFRRMYFAVLYENYTDRKHVRVLIIPADRLDDIPLDESEDRHTVIRSSKLASRLPNLRFMRDEMRRVESGETQSSPYVRAFEIMDQRSIKTVPSA